VSRIDELEVMVRALGLPYSKREGALLITMQVEGYGEVGVVVSYDEESDRVRIAVPLDVEPYHEALTWFLSENFTSTTYKYAIDYDGFVAVVYDVPSRCVRSARDLREAILEVVEGAKRVLERVEEEEKEEKEGVQR
jgi:hypothetical protein